MNGLRPKTCRLHRLYGMQLQAGREMKEPFLALMNDSKSSSQIFVNVKKTLIYSIHIRDRLDGTVGEVTNPTSSQIVLHEQIGTFISNSILKRIDLLTDKIYLIKNGFYEKIGFNSPFVKDLI